MSPTLTFDASVAEEVIEEFGHDIDSEGYVIDEDGERLTSDAGNEIHKEHFAGVEKGSIIFLDDDFNTLVEHVKRRREE